jgi:hypothetical protein
VANRIFPYSPFTIRVIRLGDHVRKRFDDSFPGVVNVAEPMDDEIFQRLYVPGKDTLGVVLVLKNPPAAAPRASLRDRERG